MINLISIENNAQPVEANKGIVSGLGIDSKSKAPPGMYDKHDRVPGGAGNIEPLTCGDICV